MSKYYKVKNYKIINLDSVKEVEIGEEDVNYNRTIKIKWDNGDSEWLAYDSKQAAERFEEIIKILSE